ncbi:MAG: cation:proton antiporter [Clostridia bacterium]|nr:cation:proton antiporter [Clostridia bacterium]
MLTSLALVFLVGLCLAAICKKLHLPRLIGMLISGIVMGPFVLDLLDPSLLGISAELRRMALVIILIKAGLSLNLKDLKKVGRPALLLSFLPATFELCAYVLFAPLLLGVTRLEAALMGAVLAAVSPAVVVPKMVSLMEAKRGTDKSIPQMILAGASLDDVFVIVLFTVFLGMAQGGRVSLISFLNIPVSILCGVVLGVLVGFLLALFFEGCAKRGASIRNSIKVIVILGFAFLLMSAEDRLSGILPLSGLLAVMSMALTVQMRCKNGVPERLAAKFGKLWLAAELLLFTLVGAAVDIRYALSAGGAVLLMLLIGLVFRSLAVVLALVKTPLNKKERLFTVLAYLPKATVQAAIGGIPLAAGLACGDLVLTAAVVGILITAPLGALCMELTEKRLLKTE